MIKHKRLLFFILSVFISGIAHSQIAFTTEDQTYDKNIKTVLLYPSANSVKDPLYTPVVPVEASGNLLLEFDELGSEFKRYYVKIINCNWDWTVSTLSAIQYLDDYNEFPITDRKISIGTRIPYVHYKFLLPRIKESGNYIVKVYRNYDEEDLAITRRLVVYQNLAAIQSTVKYSIDPSVRNTHQQIDFSINYYKANVVNPYQNLKVVLRQNHRWDKTIRNLVPVTVDENIKQAEFYYFNRENNFPGGNEYRVVEFRSSAFSGYNVARVKRDSLRAEVFVYDDKSRAGQAYSQPLIPDYDGKFIIENYETGDKETYPDYMYVNFYLDTEPADGKVYIIGGMTNWKLDDAFVMKYDTESKKYTCRALLKQGIYNYSYVMVNPQTKQFDEAYYEGSHSATQNNYDIIVYYRPFGGRSDLVIGYQNTNYLSGR
ncbi:MAG: DUF5103 domain-containing protein [Cytophagaceae bacterium]|nr:DUF5103 domain-containing protein [Cytophagaceae bacterium]